MMWGYGYGWPGMLAMSLQQLSFLLIRQDVSRVGEPSDRVVAGDGVHRQADRLQEGVTDPGACRAQDRLDLGERLLNGGKVRRNCNCKTR